MFMKMYIRITCDVCKNVKVNIVKICDFVKICIVNMKDFFKTTLVENKEIKPV